ncbi:MAG: metallophosphoesterase family protein [Dehalococcoidia bacterium]|nr:metallophosphoesterase family protein [Dehalococcoidia bacterium]MCB9484479.1 metallophosphoesterase family protein [Thermoflexaceae bacterium]
MKIGVISDTHIPSAGPEPPPQVVQAFEGVDLILHAGHAYIPSCLEWLERIAPVRSTESWLEGSGETPTRNSGVLVLEFDGHTIGMAHELILRSLGDDVLPGAIARSFPAGESLSAALQAIFGKPVDIVVFGYTHEAMVETHEGILLVNPGSPSLVGQQVRLGTVAVLDLAADSRQANIIDLSAL